MRSKIGFLINVTPRTGELDAIVSTQTSLVKVNSNTDALNYLHARMPNTTFIARGSISQDLVEYGVLSDPLGSADRWMSEMRPWMSQAPYAYWEGFNEPARAHLPQLTVFEVERQKLMAQEGYHACIGNFAVGKS